MSNIRPATRDDVLQIAALGMRFISKLKLDSRPDVERVAASVGAVLNDKNGVGFVFEKEGQVVGFLLGLAVPIWFDVLDWSAIELAWWVAEDHRGGREAVEMVRAFEAWAARMNVHRVVLSDIEFLDQAQPAGPLIERLGYTLHERAFVKVI